MNESVDLEQKCLKHIKWLKHLSSKALVETLDEEIVTSGLSKHLLLSGAQKHSENGETGLT